MILTDTHTHLYLPELEEELSGIMERAMHNKVQRFFLPNIDSSSIKPLFDLTEAYPGHCFPMMGLHPCSVKEDFQEELNRILQVMERKKVFAIGEVGIDLYWDKSFFKEQQQALRIQIQWSLEKKLPLVIHCREAFEEVMEILEEEKGNLQPGIFHCFSGTEIQAQRVIDLGFYLGIGGVVTYKNSGLDKAIANIDLKHIVLETDSPYLSPVPHRGKKNESSFITYVAEKLADIKACSIEEIAEITTANSKKIFGI